MVRLVLAIVALLLPAWAARAGAPEADLLVASTTEPAEAADLLAGFRAANPAIRLDYRKMNSTDLQERILAGDAIDIAWSSAMDLQVKLVNDGYAQAYRSPEARALPAWAVWRNEAFGTTAEPVAMVYNRAALPPGAVPASHADLLGRLVAEPDRFRGRVVTYDPASSGAGYLFLTQDVETTRRTWDLVRALGAAGVRLSGNTDPMLDQVARGEALLAYNVIGSYALERAAADARLGVVLPADYTLVISRIAFIPRTAAHVAAARRFLDYLLSQPGQAGLAARSIDPVREDALRSEGGAAGADRLAAVRAVIRPVRVGPGVLAYLDQAKRRQFLRDWDRARAGH